jgi:hypothetical protein
MQNNNIKDKYNDYLNPRKTYDNGGPFTTYNVGGSHESNPHSGIPLGEDSLVEQGETSVNLDQSGVPTEKPTGSKYIFSDRQVWSPEEIKAAGLPSSRVPVTAGEYMGKLSGKFKDKAGSKADKETLDAFTKRATQLAEQKRIQQEQLEQAMQMNSQQVAPENTEVPEGMEEYAGEQQSFDNGGSYGSMFSSMYDQSKSMPQSIEAPAMPTSLTGSGAGAAAGGADATSGMLSGAGSYMKAAGTAFDLYNTAKTGNTSPKAGSAIASGAVQGASAGMMFGPWGAAAGAVIGGASGYFGSQKAKKNIAEGQDMLINKVNAGMPNSSAWTGIGGPAEERVAAMGGYITHKPSKYASGGKVTSEDDTNTVQRGADALQVSSKLLNRGVLSKFPGNVGSMYGIYDSYNNNKSYNPADIIGILPGGVPQMLSETIDQGSREKRMIDEYAKKARKINPKIELKERYSTVKDSFADGGHINPPKYNANDFYNKPNDILGVNKMSRPTLPQEYGMYAIPSTTGIVQATASGTRKEPRRIGLNEKIKPYTGNDQEVISARNNIQNWYNNPETRRRFTQNTGMDSNVLNPLIAHGLNVPISAGTPGDGTQAQFSRYPNENTVFEKGAGKGVVDHEIAHGMGVDSILGPATQKVLGSPYDQKVKNAKRDVKRYMQTPEETYGNFHQFRTKLGLKPGEVIKDGADLEARTKAAGAESENFYRTYDNDNIVKAVNTIAQNKDKTTPTYAKNGGLIKKKYLGGGKYGEEGILTDKGITDDLASQYLNRNTLQNDFGNISANASNPNASSFLGENAGDLKGAANSAMRLYPAISNYIERDKITKPTGTYSARLNDAYNVPQVDEARAMRDINAAYNNKYRALGQMGGSQAQQRAAMLGIGAQQNEAISKTQEGLENIRINRAMQEQQYKSQIAQYNAGKSDYDRETYDKDIANYDSQRSKFTSQIGNDIGAIGLENDRMDQVANMYGYDRRGNYLVNKKTGKVATPEEISKMKEAALGKTPPTLKAGDKYLNAEGKEVTVSAYGGFLTRRSYGK